MELIISLMCGRRCRVGRVVSDGGRSGRNRRERRGRWVRRFARQERVRRARRGFRECFLQIGTAMSATIVGMAYFYWVCVVERCPAEPDLRESGRKNQNPHPGPLPA